MVAGAELAPDHFRIQLERFAHGRRDVFGAAENIDRIHGVGDAGQVGVAGDVEQLGGGRVHRKHGVSGVFEIPGHEMAVFLHILGDADHRDGTDLLEQTFDTVGLVCQLGRGVHLLVVPAVECVFHRGMVVKKKVPLPRFVQDKGRGTFTRIHLLSSSPVPAWLF